MQVVEGQGWRLVVDPKRDPYGALIGGRDWAAELRPEELSCLRQGVRTLLRQRQQLLSSLMPEEELDLELDLALPSPASGGCGDGSAVAAGSLFVALSHQASGWALRFVLTPADGSRAVEGGWTAAASAALAAALEGLTHAGESSAD